jgi:hypothetical protein
VLSGQPGNLFLAANTAEAGKIAIQLIQHAIKHEFDAILNYKFNNE